MKKIAVVSLFGLFATAAMGIEIQHANMREAYGAAENAIKHIELAQAKNRGVEFGGHAEKAIELLRHAQQ